MAVRPASLPNLKVHNDKLTEFGSISPRGKGSTGFLSKLWGSGAGTRGATTGGEQAAEERHNDDSNVTVSALPGAGHPGHVLEGQSTFYSGSLSNARTAEYLTGSFSFGENAVQRHQHRSLSSVTRALSHILEKKPAQGLKHYKDGDFRQYWMPDSSCKECYDCGDKFTAFRRRHHCRICGQIFCSSCCNQEVPGKVIGIVGSLRACTYCCKVISEYVLDVSDDFGELKEKLRKIADSEAVASPSGSRKPSLHALPSDGSVMPSRMNIFDFLPSTEVHKSVEDISIEERNLLTKESYQLRSLFAALTSEDGGILLQSHRRRLRTYTSCFTGHELVQWLIATDRVASHEQAAAVGQALVDARFIVSPMLAGDDFHDGLVLYRPNTVFDMAGSMLSSSSLDREAAAAAVVEQEPKWLQELERQDESGKCGDTQVRGAGTSSSDKFGNTVSSSSTDSSSRDFQLTSHNHNWSESCASAACMSNASQETWCNDSSQTVSAEQLCELGDVCLATFDPDNSNAECLMRDRLRDLHVTHLMALLGQLLSRAGLSLSWAEPLLQLATNVTHFVKPDVKFNSDKMDIRSYVHIKKLRTGQRLDMDVVYGTVCTKQVVHKRMRTNIMNPTIMLLQSSIEYQRVSNKFSSLDPQILQEQEYLRNCVAKIAKYQPDVLLVEKTVSRIAQELLLEAGITLVLNVKESVMQRVARCTMADMVSSIDSLVSAPTLGKCHMFELKTYKFQDGFFKTLMYFDGCPANLGCTILLRSTSYAELCKVKPVLSFLLYAYHSSALEMAFMMDQCVSVAAVDKDDSFVQTILKPLPSEARSHTRTSSGRVKPEDIPSSAPAAEPTAASPELRDVPSVADHAKPESTSNGGLPLVVHQPTLSEKPGAVSSEGALTLPMPRSSVSDESLQFATVTDPLRAGLRLAECTGSTDDEHCSTGQDSEAFVPGVAVPAVVRLKDDYALQPVRRLQSVLVDTILSVSPMVKADLPFFETAAGRCSSLRSFFPPILYWSPAMETAGSLSAGASYPGDGKAEQASVAFPSSESFDYRLDAERLRMASVDVKDPHPLITAVIEKPDDDDHVQVLLASYRAAGSRLRARSGEKNPDQRVPSRGGRGEMAFGEIAADTYLGGHEMQPRIDCLDIRHHQRISVLFSSFAHESANAPELCVNPWVVNMHFYGRNDMTLGTFLDRYCFRESYYCPSITCQTPMVKHVRRFAHDSGCLHLVTKQLDGEQPIIDASHILMWNYCRKCKQATALIPMSHSTWSMSFAKYLELRLQAQPISSRMLPECRHSLHRDYNQYFRYGRMLASFKYASITSHELCLPPLKIVFDLKLPLEILKDTVNNLHHKAFSMYTSITESLCKIRDTASDGKKLIITDMNEEHEQERTWFRDQINSILMRMPTRDGPKYEHKLILELSTEIVTLKRHVANTIHEWNQKLQKLVNLKEDKVVSKEEKTNWREPSDKLSSSVKSKKASTSDLNKLQLEDDTVMPVPLDQGVGEPMNKDPYQGTQPLPAASLLSTHAAGIGPSELDPTPDVFDNIPAQAVMVLPPSEASGAVAAAVPDPVDADISKGENSAFEVPMVATPVSTNEKAATSTPPLLEGSLNDGAVLREESTSNSTKAKSRSSKASDDSEFKQRPRSGGFEKILSSIFVSDMSLIEVALQIPLDQHYILPSVPDPPPLIIYEEEPSSIIAFTMSSSEYKKKVVDLKTQLKALHPNISLTDTLSPMDPDCPLPESGIRTNSVLAAPPSRYAQSADSAAKQQEGDFADFMKKDEVDNERFGNREDAERAKMEFLNCHIEMQFTEKSPTGEKMAQFYCKVYFAEHFRKLRKLLMPGAEDMFIHSLKRCVKWQAKGGKSGLRFCKTLDDRFILKQLSKYEIQSFLEFAPHYFSYLTDAHNEKKPTALAKIFGIYRIGFRNHSTGAAMKQDLLVMENLFYQRTLSKVFDLKGSIRNRMVSAARRKEEDVVLLDENLLRHIVESPLYVRPHSKTVLQQAVVNDSHFLSSHLIMDYSLLVGIDDESKELVVGVIDYIRTFTWDKKLEMVVKSSAFLGGQGKMPTIVSPEVYRTRFVEAMERYFYLVPDRWSGLAEADC